MKYRDSGCTLMLRSSVGRYNSENTRRSGSAKADDVYSMRAVCWIRPHPHVSAYLSSRPRTRSTATSTTITDVRKHAISNGDTCAIPFGATSHTLPTAADGAGGVRGDRLSTIRYMPLRVCGAI